MKADFAGWATKAGLKCSDGRTILADAFKHQDQARVPLVWQHGHNDPENVLGHAILEARPEGVYAYAYFNDSAKAQHARGLVEHKDINSLSIWANQLIERSGRVMHGVIREVSLVLSGANPGAVIEHVTIRHSDGDIQELDDEAIIHTGEELELLHSSVSPKQTENKDLAHMAEDATVQDVYDSLTEDQKTVVHYLIGQALQEAQDAMAQSGLETNEILEKLDKLQEGITVTHNVFEKGGEPVKGKVLSHSEVKEIVTSAVACGSLSKAVNDYALAHGIENIDTLFPDAKMLDGAQPEFLRRRTEWVNVLLGGCRKSPFSRIKTQYADITYEEARARGYVKGTLKKEEFFPVSKRVTTPTTVYKKQKLDRDDVVDITDFDVVAWLKAEMRLMLEEELARAILLSDGRDVSHDDKINEQNIRPISGDHELFATKVYVNMGDANSTVQEIIDALVTNRKFYKGTGLPIMFTTETYIAKFLLLKDTTGRRIYNNLGEVASELRVSQIVPVEAMEEYENLVAILVNPVDYAIGADKGGEVNMFDDFDIDYNQQKYLIETRVSGALTKLKSALVVVKTADVNVLVTPTAPTFDPETGEVTITNTTGVTYKNEAGTVINAAGSPYQATAGVPYIVTAEPASGYYFATSENDTWRFVWAG